ncbi:unnamed protein product [Paramecium octaurelia]|uniref:Uncharacterized protein n=1 Tax=Paramecium octaurelia TaxID=43137 RepID=A0A8S1Y0X6_PAROT|nr:unnamed protein product [Paramecium octaurelia]
MTSILIIQLGIDGLQQWKFLFRKYKTIRKIAQYILKAFKKKKKASPIIFQ